MNRLRGPNKVDELPNCWEVMRCTAKVRKSCAAYPDHGKECWKITGTRCNIGGREFDSLAEKIISCRNKCPYYKEHLKKVYH